MATEELDALLAQLTALGMSPDEQKSLLHARGAAKVEVASECPDVMASSVLDALYSGPGDEARSVPPQVAVKPNGAASVSASPPACSPDSMTSDAASESYFGSPITATATPSPYGSVTSDSPLSPSRGERSLPPLRSPPSATKDSSRGSAPIAAAALGSPLTARKDSEVIPLTVREQALLERERILQKKEEERFAHMAKLEADMREREAQMMARLQALEQREADAVQIKKAAVQKAAEEAAHDQQLKLRAIIAQRRIADARVADQAAAAAAEAAAAEAAKLEAARQAEVLAAQKAEVLYKIQRKQEELRLAEAARVEEARAAAIKEIQRREALAKVQALIAAKQKEEEERQRVEILHKIKQKEAALAKEQARKEEVEALTAVIEAREMAAAQRALEREIRHKEAEMRKLEEAEELRFRELQLKMRHVALQQKLMLKMDRHKRAVALRKKKMADDMAAKVEHMSDSELLAMHGEGPKKFKLVPFGDGEVDWGADRFSGDKAWLRPEDAVIHTFERNGTGAWVMRTGRRRLRLKAHPFSAGGMRIAFFMEDLVSHTRCVAKVSKTLDPRENSTDYFQNDIYTQLVAKEWADKFVQAGAPKNLDYVMPFLIQVQREGKMQMMACEPLLHGEFVKFTNNAKYKVPEYATPQAFSHYTWDTSKKTLMVCDLQGSAYVLTDPQIHEVVAASALAGSYGIGNLGQRGVVDFFGDHECNDICRALKLTSNKMMVRKATSTAGEKHLPTKMTFASREAYEPAPGICLCGAHIAALTREQYEKRRAGVAVWCGPCASAVARDSKPACSICSFACCMTTHELNLRYIPKDAAYCSRTDCHNKATARLKPFPFFSPAD